VAGLLGHDSTEQVTVDWVLMADTHNALLLSSTFGTGDFLRRLGPFRLVERKVTTHEEQDPLEPVHVS
jgi:hypothetical protein